MQNLTRRIHKNFSLLSKEQAFDGTQWLISETFPPLLHISGRNYARHRVTLRR
jgi:hypothetical protein